MNGNEELKGGKNHFTDAGLMLSSVVNALKPQCTSSVATTCDHLNGGKKKKEGQLGPKRGPRIDSKEETAECGFTTSKTGDPMPMAQLMLCAWANQI